jgi:hypothetical protein
MLANSALPAWPSVFPSLLLMMGKHFLNFLAPNYQGEDGQA